MNFSCQIFFKPVIYGLVTWITTSPNCRHLMYANKMTLCLFVCMGIGEAGPSSLFLAGLNPKEGSLVK